MHLQNSYRTFANTVDIRFAADNKITGSFVESGLYTYTYNTITYIHVLVLMKYEHSGQ